MSNTVEKYLESARQKFSNGNTSGAEADLDLAELEIEMLADDNEAERLRAELKAVKERLSSTEIDPQRRESVLNSIERRAENIKLSLQQKKVVKYEIQDFVAFINQNENKSALTADDLALLDKQIAGFTKLSGKYEAEELANDLTVILNDLTRDYEQLLEGIADGNYSTISRATENFESTSSRFEREIEGHSDQEVLQELIEKHAALNQQKKEALLQQEQKEEEDARKQEQEVQDENERQKNELQAGIDAFYTVPEHFPPQPLLDEYDNTLGRVVFSNSPITIGEEDPAAIKNHFASGEEVYAMIYFPQSRQEHGIDRQGLKFYIRDFEPGGSYSAMFQYSSVPAYTTDNGEDSNTFKHYDLDVFVAHKHALDPAIPKEFLSFLVNHFENNKKIPNKVYKFEVNVLDPYNTIAKGIFTYDLTNGLADIKKLHLTHVNAHLASFKLPESKRDDDALAQQIKEVMIKDGVDARKVVFSTEDWGVLRHHLTGNITGRSIWAYVIYKNEEGEFIYNDIQFTQEYIGNDFAGPIKKAGYGTEGGYILEENF